MGCKSIPRLPPAFHQASLTDSHYPFVLHGGERGAVRERCFAQKHNTMTWQDLELGPLNLKSSARTAGPSGYSLLNNIAE